MKSSTTTRLLMQPPAASLLFCIASLSVAETLSLQGKMEDSGEKVSGVLTLEPPQRVTITAVGGISCDGAVVVLDSRWAKAELQCSGQKAGFLGFYQHAGSLSGEGDIGGRRFYLGASIRQQ